MSNGLSIISITDYSYQSYLCILSTVLNYLDVLEQLKFEVLILIFIKKNVWGSKLVNFDLKKKTGNVKKLKITKIKHWKMHEWVSREL